MDLTFGGSTDWAVDLGEFYESPARSAAKTIDEGWDNFKHALKLYGDPYIQGNRTGSWTEITCTIPEVENILMFTPSESWKALDCDHAWDDAITIWKEIDRKTEKINFIDSISNTFHTLQNMGCHTLFSPGNCDAGFQCHDSQGKGSGSAGYEVMNSIVHIHQAIVQYYNSLEAARTQITFDFPSFANNFAPIPDDLPKFNVLIDLLGLGGSIISAPFFNNSNLRPERLDDIRDITYAVVGRVAVNLIKDTYKDEKYVAIPDWNPAAKDSFLSYVGQVMLAWRNSTEQVVARLFSGEDEPIEDLWNLISDGKLIAGSSDGHGSGDFYSTIDLQMSTELAFYGFIIPQIWAVSGTRGFVVDTGYDCGTVNPLTDYILDSTGEDTYVCDESTNKMYYLVAATGDAQTCECSAPCQGGAPPCVEHKFRAPPGLAHIHGKSYGGITKEDLVIG
ncbi:hypothetical protein AJ79_06357 [Helicocarpus griseus UAMH5409]|uniref:Uncharacterized protein n=1 Tax=Helicocarpus griseus UAMH5409 TaxID=1447875 RepID=A0A2B7XDT5_9EURO|nr:hypothetical protein AJ79_06357 [Helicocarpus griseus UAMH5409]